MQKSLKWRGKAYASRTNLTHDSFKSSTFKHGLSVFAEDFRLPLVSNEEIIAPVIGLWFPNWKPNII